MRQLPRLVSPAGFALALLLFLLPFVAISCDAPQNAGSIEATYTGTDLVLGADPKVRTTGELSGGAQPFAPDEEPSTGAQLPAILTVLLIAAGLAASLAPALRTRKRVLAGAAALSAALLVGTELIARAHLVAWIRDVSGPAATIGGQTFAVTDEVAAGLVHTRIGYWLALAALLAVLFWWLILAVRDRARR